MEDIEEFERQLDNLIKDAVEKGHISVSTLAWVLMGKGLGFFYKAFLTQGGS